MRIQKVNLSWYGLVASTGCLFLLAFLMLCPLLPEGASAEGEPSLGDDPYGTTSTTPSISMALTSRTELDVTPTTNGTFQTGTAQLKVAVTVPDNYTSGYKVYMNAVDGNTLKGTSGNSSTIKPISANTNKNNFPNNTWGYSLNKPGSATTTFQPVPTASTIIDDTDDLTNTYDLTFATKVNMDIPSDQYSNSVIVSVVAEPELLTGLMLIDNMQEMTSQVCSESKEGATKQLVDTRDGQKYWVAKLRDGNCWMTQNLALDITTEGLKASDTDIARDWTASQSADPSVTTVYPPKATEYTVPTSGDTSQTNTLSWNLSGQGKNQWVLGTPLKMGDRCGVEVIDINVCTKVGLVKIDDSWSPTFEAKEGVFNAPNTNYTGQTTYITLDYDKKQYDPHYLIGNYYTWNAATAGTGGRITSSDAAGSICPKGWQLPSAGDNAPNPSTTQKTFARLLTKYLNISATYPMSFESSTGNYNITTKPLYFMCGGFISPKTGSSGLGYVGYYRSSRAKNEYNYAEYMGLSADSVSVSHNYGSRDFGYFVRCVAR